MAQKSGLGRGLSSLIPQKNTEKGDVVEPRGVAPRSAPSAVPHTRRSPVFEEAPETSEASRGEKSLSVIGVSAESIVANTQQPRVYFDEEKLTELANSIKAHGIMQPLVVVPKGAGYELISGERRLRAAKKAGLAKVPVIVRGSMDEQKKLELAIIENVQRHDLNVIEEGKSYKKLADEFDLSQEEIAKQTGKSRSVVANRMRLAKLPVEVQRGVIEGRISEGHAKVILSLDNPEKQRALYDLIVSQKMSVREAERQAGSVSPTGTRVGTHVRSAKSPQERVLEEQLSSYFGTKVTTKKKGGGGEITLSYFSDEELKEILSKLKM